jgi:hypothetical protein
MVTIHTFSLTPDTRKGTLSTIGRSGITRLITAIVSCIVTPRSPQYDEAAMNLDRDRCYNVESNGGLHDDYEADSEIRQQDTTYLQ